MAASNPPPRGEFAESSRHAPSCRSRDARLTTTTRRRSTGCAKTNFRSLSPCGRGRACRELVERGEGFFVFGRSLPFPDVAAGRRSATSVSSHRNRQADDRRRASLAHLLHARGPARHPLSRRDSRSGCIHRIWRPSVIQFFAPCEFFCGRDRTNRLLAANFVVSPVKHDFACSGAIFPKVGANSSKDFAYFHQTGDDFAKRGSPEPPGPDGAAGQAGRFSRRFCEIFVRHFAATSRARQTAKLPARERKADVVRRNSRFLRLDFAFWSASLARGEHWQPSMELRPGSQWRPRCSTASCQVASDRPRS
jgi:hypothetical protein